MILLHRNDISGTTDLVFDGTSDVRKFFFLYENVVAVSIADKEKYIFLLWHLDGDDFEFYYDPFACNG